MAVDKAKGSTPHIKCVDNSNSYEKFLVACQPPACQRAVRWVWKLNTPLTEKKQLLLYVASKQFLHLPVRVNIHSYSLFACLQIFFLPFFRLCFYKLGKMESRQKGAIFYNVYEFFEPTQCCCLGITMRWPMSSEQKKTTYKQPNIASWVPVYPTETQICGIKWNNSCEWIHLNCFAHCLTIASTCKHATILVAPVNKHASDFKSRNLLVWPKITCQNKYLVSSWKHVLFLHNGVLTIQLFSFVATFQVTVVPLLIILSPTTLSC